MNARVLMGVVGVLLLLTAGATAQTIVKGAQGYAANGHRYVMISATSWEAARAWARARGGDLATLDDAAESAWIYSTFSTTAGKYTIGLAAVDVPGTLTWSDGSSSAYRAWASGEPKLSSSERYTVVQGATSWVVRSTNFAPFYLVEWSGPIRVPQEYATIDEALSAMQGSGTIELELAPGVHLVTAPRTLTAGNVAGTIRGAGRSQTVISVASSNATLNLVGDWTLEDLAVTRGTPVTALTVTSGALLARDVAVDGGGIIGLYPMVQLIGGSSLVLKRCEVTWTLFLTTTVAPWFASVHATDSVFRYCGALVGENVSGLLSNCTISPASNGSIRAFYGPTQMINCVAWPVSNNMGDYVTARNCIIQREVPPGSGNISVNPNFETGTCRPRPGSPCIDAGDAELMLGGTTDFEGLPRISGGKLDIGAYELQQTPPPACSSDFNGDGFITFEDFDAFVAAFEAGC